MEQEEFTLWAEVALPLGVPFNLLYGVPRVYSDCVRRGQMVRVDLQNRKGIWGVIWSLTAEPPSFAVLPIEIPEGWPHFSEEWIDFLSWAGEYYQASPNRLVDVAIPSFAGASQEELRPKRKREEPSLPDSSIGEVPPPLVEGQKRALAQISPSLQSGYAPFLLHGVTGSGKTRLYAELIKEVVASGKCALVLVPEIALTPQISDHFSKLTQLPVVLYHSGLSPGQRRENWRKVLAGEVKLLLGTRSASLLPLQNLGLIIVDEEHDSSYKQEDPTPHYHAKDLLLWRARQLKIPIILGSATPSLESRELVEQKKIRLVEMRERIHNRPLPQVELVDMKEVARRFQKSLISPQLREAILDVREEGGQTILLHNRRGYAPAWSCEQCGESVRCPNCDIPLTYHQKRQQLHCHWCDRLLSPQQPCRRCGHRHYRPIGFGIEQVEEELLEWFPDLKLSRFDRDTTAKSGELERILDQFRSGETELLLGTQMVAKGHDFPRVQLVGVVSADAGLAIPDFRAGERMFQLLTQVAGRAGRGERSGRVILQTYSPNEPILQWALHHDYEGFREVERRQRKQHGYPPFTRMVEVELSSKNEREVRQKGDQLANRLRATMKKEEQEELLGPAEAPIYMVKQRYRIRLLYKGLRAALFRTKVQQALEQTGLLSNSTVQVKIDVDPQAML